MAERREDAAPVPRDRPDQQASDEPDPWDPPRTGDGDTDDLPPEEAPDVDQAGAGPRGAPRSGSVHPEQPVPDEPSG
ncbi:hypothetical protein [Streptomyces sp. NPDC018031]|uniref:hypothetical protein n=1 Tax=Streptomyces sp. NPDC018031 TaxID=3365033 RepID=UPI0037B88C34